MKNRFRILFGGIILVMVIWFLKKIDLGQVYSLISSADKYYLILAFFITLFSFIFLNVRSIYVIRKVIKPGFWFSAKTLLAGKFVDTVTPGAQIGGDPLRAYYIGKKYRKSKTKVFGAILVDRFLHLSVSVFFITLSVIYILRKIPLDSELEILFQTIFLFIFLLVFFILFFAMQKKKIDISRTLKRLNSMNFWNSKKQKRIKFEKIWIEHLGNFMKTFKDTLKDRKTLFFGTFLSFVYFILNYATSYFLFQSFGIPVRFFLIIIVVSLADLLGDFSPSPGGIGIIEGFMILAYSALGFNLYVATAVSLLNRIIFYLFSLGLGGLSLINLESGFFSSNKNYKKIGMV